MDITGLSVDSIPTLAMGMAQIDTLSKVNTSLLDMSLDTMSAQGSEIAKMMELSVNPAVGGNFDMSV
ncbi:MAG: YjfB family protein [Lachnospiraceae bacterium]|nr:YjfB family protein [Lachnospiraceae bacterium]